MEIHAYVVPHPPLAIPGVGDIRENEISATIQAYSDIADEIVRLPVQTILVISPHATAYRDYFHISPGRDAKGDFKAFGRPDIKQEVQYDEELIQRVIAIAEKNNCSAGTDGEREPQLDHGTMVPLFYIQQAYEKAHKGADYRVVRIGLSGLSLEEHYFMGMVLARAMKELNRKCVVLASGDLSHCLTKDGPYGFCEEGPNYDAKMVKTLQDCSFYELLDIDSQFLEKSCSCGHGSITMMAGILDGWNVNGRVLSYEGPFGVGYVVAAFEQLQEDVNCRYLEKRTKKALEECIPKDGEDELLYLARLSVESYIRCGIRLRRGEEDTEMRIWNNLSSEAILASKGVFVTLKKGEKLRGCIGTILPIRESLAEEIISNAISAACEDNRFPCVTVGELNEISYEISILGIPEAIESIEELDPIRYGIVVSKNNRRGVLLPSLPGITTVEEQIAIAKQKAGIMLEEEVSIQRFEVIQKK